MRGLIADFDESGHRSDSNRTVFWAEIGISVRFAPEYALIGKVAQDEILLQKATARQILRTECFVIFLPVGECVAVLHINVNSDPLPGGHCRWQSRTMSGDNGTPSRYIDNPVSPFQRAPCVHVSKQLNRHPDRASPSLSYAFPLFQPSEDDTSDPEAFVPFRGGQLGDQSVAA